MALERIRHDDVPNQQVETDKRSNLVIEVLDALSSRPALLASAVAEAAIATALTFKGSPRLGAALFVMSGVNMGNFTFKSLNNDHQKNEDHRFNKFDFLDGAKFNKLESARDRQPGSRGFDFLISDTVDEMSKQPFGKSRFDNLVNYLQSTDKKDSAWDISIEKGFPVLTDTDSGQKYTMAKPGDGAPINP